MASNVWNDILARIETKVNRHSFYTWFKPTRLVDETSQELSIRVPNGLYRDWLTKHYAGVITEAVAELEREGLKIVFITEKETSASRPHTRPPDPLPVQPQKPVSRPRGLNPLYTFDTFVVGSSNQFAHAASLAVAEAPSRSYNPLFLYGGVGLGKKHLMHAIGQYLLDQNDQLQLT